MQGAATGTFGLPSPSASSCMGSPRARRLTTEALDARVQDACSPCSTRAAAQETGRQPLTCVTNEGEEYRDIASQAQLLPAPRARHEADCPSSLQQACQENSGLSCPGTADPAERSCMQSGSAALGVQLETSAAVSAEHMKNLADHQTAAAKVHQRVLAEQPINEQKSTPSKLASAGEAKEHKLNMLSTRSEQHRQVGCRQLENRPDKSSGAQSQAQPVSDDAKQSEQPAQLRSSSMQAHQAFSAQPGRTGRQGRLIPRSQAIAPLLVS